jgi:PAS domain S-box-containing protein
MRAVTPAPREAHDAGVPAGRHVVQFYDDDAWLAHAVARFLGAGIGAGGAAVVIATAEHREEIDRRLAGFGIDVAALRTDGRYVALDARETLDRLVVAGGVDPARFADVVETVVRGAATRGGGEVRGFGEMVALLWAEGRREAALSLERAWNDLGARVPLSLLCAYPLGGFGVAADGAGMSEVCDLHDRVGPAEEYASLGTDGDRLRFVAQLQQKARALENEVERRRGVEETLGERNRTLRALVEASPVPIVVLDVEGTVLFWNPAAERVFGWSEDEVRGRPIPIVPPEKTAECAWMRKAVACGQTFFAAETHRLRRDGSLADVVVSAAPLTDRAGTVRSMVMLFEDVTLRKRAEAARQKAVCELTTVYEAGRMLAGELDVERLLQGLTDAATQLAGAQVGALFYAADENADDYEPHASAGAWRAAPPALRLPRSAFDPISARGILRVDAAGSEPRSGPPPHGVLDDLGLSSRLLVAVVGRGGKTLGGLLLGHAQPGAFTDESERIVTRLAAHAAVAIDTARLYDAERRARGEAEATSRAKDEFLAMLGHELRNPLSAVRNAIVAARLDPSRRDRALDVARRGADRLGQLVDDLLDVARVTQGRITLRRQRLSFAGVVERALEATRSLLEERAVATMLAIADSGVEVDGDTTRLEQVVVNLVSNAAKFSDPGGAIAVAVTPERGDVVLRVADRGVGIAPEMLPRVFDLFAQADRSLDRPQGGLGIGLTVVKRLVELHGGSVEARSDGIGRGAEFVVRLPALVAPPETTAPAADAASSVRPCARIVLVDDNADVAESLSMLLELLGHRVRVAVDGPSALELARTAVPDVMLIDIGLPGMDGYEVARRVRRDPALGGVALIALTGYGRDEDRERARDAGFDHHLVKPVDPHLLEGLVARLPSVAGASPGVAIH